MTIHTRCGCEWIANLPYTPTITKENVSEYGVHWNFFFTLGFLRLLHAVFVIPSKYSGIVAIVISSLYQVVLIYGGGTEFIVSDKPRTNLISMNKEGLFSVVGYFSIFLFGLQVKYERVRSRKILMSPYS